MPDRSITYWPFLISLDLVNAPADDCAAAVNAEFSRFARDEPVHETTFPFQSLETLFSDPGEYFASPTRIYVVPTTTRWTVLWNNSFHCTGYDSLCHCLTLNHGLETLHFQSSDDDAFYLAGTLIRHRLPAETEPILRSVQASKDDSSHWCWYESGPVQPYENVDHYAARLKRNRLNEEILADYLTALGCDPRQESVYERASRVTCFVRQELERSLDGRPFSYILDRCA